jgi:PKD repeat protein
MLQVDAVVWDCGMRKIIKQVFAITVAIIVSTLHAHALLLPPVADFTASPTNGFAPFAVTFTDLSTGPINNRFWDFGDSNTTNVSTTVLIHTYEIPGTYSIELTVTGPGGVSSYTQTDMIAVIPEPSTLVLVGIGLLGAMSILRPRA